MDENERRGTRILRLRVKLARLRRRGEVVLVTHPISPAAPLGGAVSAPTSLCEPDYGFTCVPAAVSSDAGNAEHARDQGQARYRYSVDGRICEVAGK